MGADCHYAANFLQESFAGLIKYKHISYEKFISVFEFEYKDVKFEFYKNKILEYAKIESLTSKIK